MRRRSSRCTLRAAQRRCGRRTATLATRELLELAHRGLTTASSGRGEAAPLEPYDGVSLERCRARRWTRYAAGAARTPTAASGARVLDACRARRPAPGAGRGRPRAVGPRRAPRRAAGRGAARRRAARRASRSTRRSAPTDRAGAAAAAPRPRRRGLRLREAQGRHRRRRRPRRGRARRGRARRRAAARRQRRVDGRARRSRAIEALAPAGLELVEEPVHGVARAARGARARAGARSRWTRRPPSPARWPPAPPTPSA